MTQESSTKRLQRFFFAEYIDTKKIVFDSLSEKIGTTCLWGKTRDEMHKKICGRFTNEVERETIKRLQHLIDSITPVIS